MTKRIMSLCALAIAAVFAFAFKAEPAKVFADQQFYLTPGGDRNDPLDFVALTTQNCPSTGAVCAIDVFNADVYTLAEAIAAGNSAWAGQPKVNQAALETDMAAAVAAIPDPYTAPSGRVISKRN
ncbi:hypothetical protein [Chitinophaga cymbidii]|uniref:Uncharacterized protein n=1 Tax=Chitinophaga cymbidii TaxID=1096750 RepID=A0A512RQ14_9BACT|nr:hypothetical protein [Chitinophaga cymbidii]GEP97780.1 hypothetical protein CCY01nite_40400 [Chitinophaga cymbidii]